MSQVRWETCFRYICRQSYPYKGVNSCSANLHLLISNVQVMCDKRTARIRLNLHTDNNIQKTIRIQIIRYVLKCDNNDNNIQQLGIITIKIDIFCLIKALIA